MTSSSGTVACSLRYDPFGNGAGRPAGQTNPCNTGSTIDDYFFQSQRLDPATGDYQIGSRTYDPTKSAFLTADQARTSTPTQDPSVGIDPLTRNTYTFVNGDPLNLKDPTGHDAALAAQLAVMSECGTHKNPMACSGLSTSSSMDQASMGVPQIARLTHRRVSQVGQGAYLCSAHHIGPTDCARLLQQGYSQNQRESRELGWSSCSVYGEFNWSSSGPGNESCKFETPPQEASGNFKALIPIGIMAVAEFILPEAVGAIGRNVGRVFGDSAS